jgi:hypothetical protein
MPRICLSLLLCHRSVQNQPVVIESKPATFMVSKGFEVSWQVGSHFGGQFLRVIDESEARASSDQMQNTVTGFVRSIVQIKAKTE